VLHPTCEAWGGAEWFLHSVCNALVREDGAEVTVYTHRWTAPPGERTAYTVIEHRGGGALTGPWDWDHIARRLARRWARHDVLFLHNHPAVEWAARARARATLPPCVWYCQEPPRHLYDDPSDDEILPAGAGTGIGRTLAGAAFYRTAAARRIIGRWRLRRAVRRLGAEGWAAELRRSDRAAVSSVDLVIANSRYTAGRVEELYGRRARVIYPLLEDFRPSLWPPPAERKEPVVLWVGRMTAAKRPLEMIAAWGRACAREPALADYTLIMVGDGPLGGAVRRAAAGLRGGWRIVRGVDRAGLMELYRTALVTVHLAAHEPFGLVPVESICSGTPVIAHCSGGVAETVLDGRTGWCLERPDVETLAEALAGIPGRRRELEVMGREGAGSARRDFDFGKTLAALRQVLAGAAGGVIDGSPAVPGEKGGNRGRG